MLGGSAATESPYYNTIKGFRHARAPLRRPQILAVFDRLFDLAQAFIFSSSRILTGACLDGEDDDGDGDGEDDSEDEDEGEDDDKAGAF